MQPLQKVRLGKLSFDGHSRSGVSATFESVRPRMDVEEGTTVSYIHNGAPCNLGTVDKVTNDGRSVNWTFRPINAVEESSQSFLAAGFIKGGAMTFHIGEYECRLVGGRVKLVTKAVVSVNPKIIVGDVPATISLRNPLEVKVDICDIDVDVFFEDTHIASVIKSGIVFDLDEKERSSKKLQVSLNIRKLLHLAKILHRKTVRILINRMDIRIGSHTFPLLNVIEDGVDFEVKVLGLLNIAGLF